MGALEFVPRQEGQSTDIRLEWSSTGVDVARSNDNGDLADVEPADDCPADGPTFCAKGDVPAIIEKATSGEGWTDAALDEMSSALRLDRVAEFVIEEDPSTVHIVVSPGIPFATLAALTAQLQAQLAGREESTRISLEAAR